MRPHPKHAEHKKGNKLSEYILGGQDGLVNVLGLMLGLAAATSSIRVIIAGGLAATFAESLSMAAVAYTSKMADRDHYVAERAQEKREIHDVPDIEEQEVRDIYAAKGFSGKLLEDIVAHIVADEELWADTMMREELQLSPIAKRDVHVYTTNVGIATIVGSIIPLVPVFFFPVHVAILVSLIASAVVLGGIGVYKARVTVGNPGKSALQMFIIGMGAALAGYLIGLIFRA